MRLLIGDCREVMAGLEPGSVDACVCDPPYELGFMGKMWDASGVAYDVSLWARVLELLKPGAHLLAFGGTRTSHRLTCAIEDAGFEIRDSLDWIYGSGFPKSLDVGKAIDKAAGAERGVLRVEDRRSEYDGRKRNSKAINTNWRSAEGRTDVIDVSTRVITEPATHEAKQWDGWGTALKPAHEPIILARKPFKGTVADCVCEHGTGGINVDGCRVGTDIVGWGGGAYGGNTWTDENCGLSKPGAQRPVSGRWPPNVILTHSPDCGAICAEDCPVREIDRQGGESTSGNLSPTNNMKETTGWSGGSQANRVKNTFEQNSGGASRFFPVFRYEPKASRAEREAGCDNLPPKSAGECTDRTDGTAGLDSPRAGAGRTSGARNHHPTVKPIALMAWLVRLVTPPGGIVIDPFMGSGTTGIAAYREGCEFVGIEREPEYFEIAKARIEAEQKQRRLF